jgi:hypothetical protein
MAVERFYQYQHYVASDERILGKIRMESVVA